MLVWILAAGFVLWHAGSVRNYLDRVSAESFQTPPADLQTRDVPLGVAHDGAVWLRLVEERVAKGEWRLSRTRIDGPPEGREVLWHSAWSGWLEGLARLRVGVTGEDFPRALSRAAHWAQVPLWLAASFGGAWWIWRRWGVAAACVFVVGAAGHRGFYLAFYPGYFDHHGLAALCGLGSVLGMAVWGFGAGRQGRGAEAGAMVSAICGATGLAVSASSVAPVLGLLGLAGFVAAGGSGALEDADFFDRGAALWRRWGRWGAVASLILYALEFAPDRLGWRLEVNHPVYAAAWWGGAELIAAWWARCGQVSRRPGALRLGGALLALLFPVLLVLIAGAKVFGVADPFLGAVHRHIDEFMPIWRVPGNARWLFVVSLLPLLVGFFRLRGGDEETRATCRGLVLLALALSVIAAFQHRWWSIASVAQLTLAAWLAADLGGGRPRRGGMRAVYLAALVGPWLPGPWFLAREQARVERVRDVQTGEAMQLLHRDIAWTLRARWPREELVLLASPNASVGVAYHAAARSLGTLYWENRAGLRAAAEILAGGDEAGAAEKLSRAGVTHLVLIEPGEFTAQYRDALETAGEPVPELENTLGRRLLEGRDPPAWAQAIPYAVPPQFSRMKARVALYVFAPGQTKAEALRGLGVARLISGDEAGGRRVLREAAASGQAEAALLLAWRIAGDGAASDAERAEAVVWAERAVGSAEASPTHRRVLAAAYAAARRWPEAQATALLAIELARDAGNARLVAELEEDFARYRDSAGRGEARAR
jgi:hypothetical protein